MGGLGSGGGRAYAERLTTTNARTINATELVRTGHVRPEPGQMTATLVWEIEYPGGGVATYGLMLSATWQPNGRSLRWWLHCTCGRRCCTLYQPRWWSTGYACRRCCRLLYPTQCLSPEARARHRAAKLLAQVKSSPDVVEHRKPPRMHRRRFDAIVAKAEACSARADRLRERVQARRRRDGGSFASDLREEQSWRAYR